MAIGKLVWAGNSIYWHVTDEDSNGVQTERLVELRRSKRKTAQYETITRAQIAEYDREWGFVVSPELEMVDVKKDGTVKPIASIVFVVRYDLDGPAHIVDGPYRIID
jgi:hypothetical protein